jgi:hypothetical protein
MEAAMLNEKLEKWTEALECAKKGLLIARDCLGKDHPFYEKDAKDVQSLRQRVLDKRHKSN